MLCLDISNTLLTAQLTDQDGNVLGRVGIERFGEDLLAYYWSIRRRRGLCMVVVDSGHTDTLQEAIELAIVRQT